MMRSAISTLMCSSAWWPPSNRTSGSASSVPTLSEIFIAHSSRPWWLLPMLKRRAMVGLRGGDGLGRRRDLGVGVIALVAAREVGGAAAVVEATSRSASVAAIAARRRRGRRCRRLGIGPTMTIASSRRDAGMGPRPSWPNVARASQRR